MERTFFIELAERGPFVILDERLYQLSDRAPQTDGADEVQPVLSIDGNILGLVAADSINNLQRFYTQTNRASIDDQMQKYLQERLNKEVKTQNEFKKYLDGNKAVQFIVYEVFPHFMDKDEDIEGMLRGETPAVDQEAEGDHADVEKILQGEDREITLRDYQQVKAELIKEIEDEYGQAAKQLKPQDTEAATQAQQAPDDDLDALLTDHYQKIGVLQPAPLRAAEVKQGNGLVEIIGSANALVINGKVYLLRPSGQGNNASNITIAVNGARLEPEYYTNAESVESAYQNFLAKSIKIDAVEKYEDQVRQIEETKAKMRGIEGIAEKDRFFAGDIGFVRRNSTYYAALRVPKFAMKHPKREEYYKFEECRVGVSVECDRRDVHIGEPCVIDQYRHPFLSGNGTFQKICNLSHWNGRFDKATMVAKRLSDAKNVIMNGMTVKSFRSHGGTDIHDSSYWSVVLEDKLDGRRISKEEAERQGYQITNFLWVK